MSPSNTGAELAYTGTRWTRLTVIFAVIALVAGIGLLIFRRKKVRS